ncbi:MAG: PrgI family protein [Patescibacteria group bacterium]
MQFQIPQFIETEDKIVGPLSIRQFAYVVAAAGFAAMLYFIINTVVWRFVAIPIVAIGIAFAFIKVNGGPLIGLAIAAGRFYWKPQTFVWQPEHPQIKKTEFVNPATSFGLALERIATGLALKTVWRQVQVGSKTTSPAETIAKSLPQTKERYEILQRLTGARQAARRVDYR